MKFNFRTNLDDAKRYVVEMNAGWNYNNTVHVPRVGERIRFNAGIPNLEFDLQVCDVTYDSSGAEATVELWLVPGQFASVQAWLDMWKQRRRGRI